MSIAQALKNTELFKDVELVDLEALVTRMDSYHFSKGQVLFKENDDGDTMFIIQKGSITIYIQDKSGEDKEITRYEKDAIFGELSPLDQRPRSASARADEDLEVLALDRRTFLDFLEERPQIGLAMMRSLAQRLRVTTRLIETDQVTSEAAPANLFARTGARSKSAVELLERVAKEDDTGPIKLDLPDIVEVPYRAESKKAGHEVAKIAQMGIFDRIAAPLQERLEKEKKDHPN